MNKPGPILTIYRIILILFIWMGTEAYAQEKPVLTIVRGQDFPPYHFTDSSGVETGFVIDTIRETAALTGIRVQFKQFPWSRCLKMVETGKADAMMNLFKTPEREIFMHFDENIIAHETNQFFILAPPLFDYNGDFKSISTHRIATIRNYSYGKHFDNFTFPNIFPLETEQELINSLLNNRCDIIIGNRLAIRALINQMNLKEQITALAPDVSFEPLYIGFSKMKGHEVLSKNFSEMLNQFKQTQGYRNILKKYPSFSH